MRQTASLIYFYLTIPVSFVLCASNQSNLKRPPDSPGAVGCKRRGNQCDLPAISSQEELVSGRNPSQFPSDSLEFNLVDCSHPSSPVFDCLTPKFLPSSFHWEVDESDCERQDLNPNEPEVDPLLENNVIEQKMNSSKSPKIPSSNNTNPLSDSNSYSEFQLPTPTHQDPVVESSSKSSNEQTIEDNSTLSTNQNSSHPNSIHSQSNNLNYGVIKIPLGNICDSSKAVKRMPFTSFFRLKKFAKNFHYGSNNFDSVLCFRYASSVFNTALNRNEIEKADLLIKFADGIQVIFSTFSSQPYSLKPYYFLFENDNLIFMREHTKAPLYFLFTSLSYLMRGVESGNEATLKQLIKTTCERLFTSRFLIERWSFLIRTLLHYDISVTPSVRKATGLRYDISIVHFIYNEMKFGNETKDLFKAIWITSKKKNFRRCNLMQLNGDDLLVIPTHKEKKVGSFEKAARKLYQLKFTELIFKEWNSISDLLEEYIQLKVDFYSIPIDFRLHTFNREQFELLNEALERICSLPVLVSTIELPIFSTFLLELNYFTNFKCFIFMTDFNSLIDYGDPNDWNFFFISTVKIVERITSISKIFDTFYNCISAIPNKHNVLTETFGNQITSFEAIITFIIPYKRSNYSELINQQLNFDSLCSILTDNNRNYDYFTCQLNNFKDLNRLAIGEFITELRETINSNNNEHINKIFFSVEYQKFRRLWSFIPLTLSKSSAIEIKKQYLEYFEQFLILYSQ